MCSGQQSHVWFAIDFQSIAFQRKFEALGITMFIFADCGVEDGFLPVQCDTAAGVTGYHYAGAFARSSSSDKNWTRGDMSGPSILFLHVRVFAINFYG